MEHFHKSEFTEILNAAFVQDVLKPLVIAVGSFFSAKAAFYIGNALHSGYKENVETLWEKNDLVERFGEFVVITNSMDPLGAEFAKKFAKEGHSLILIGPDDDEHFKKVQLSVLEYIRKDKGRKMLVFDKNQNCDDHSVYSKIEKELRNEQIKGKIGILINNSGIVEHPDDNFLTLTQRYVINDIHNSIVDFFIITKSVLQIMIENKKGLIVNVTTPANSCDPGFPVSMKHFAEEFNRIIRRELNKCRVTGIILEAIHPGSISICDTYSTSSKLSPTPEEFVNSAFKVIGRVQSSSGYWVHSVQNVLSDIIPNFIEDLFRHCANQLGGPKKSSPASDYEIICGSGKDDQNEKIKPIYERIPSYRDPRINMGMVTTISAISSFPLRLEETPMKFDLDQLEESKRNAGGPETEKPSDSLSIAVDEDTTFEKQSSDEKPLVAKPKSSRKSKRK